MQIANDLAEDLEDKIDLNLLQQWGQSVIVDYSNGRLPSAGEAPYWSQGKTVVADEMIPDSIRRAWDDPPVVALRTHDGGTAECVVIGWYLHGALVGSPSYEPDWKPWYLHRLSPGVYVYAIEK